jgi:hypothetical protein
MLWLLIASRVSHGLLSQDGPCLIRSDKQVELLSLPMKVKPLALLDLFVLGCFYLFIFGGTRV